MCLALKCSWKGRGRHFKLRNSLKKGLEAAEERKQVGERKKASSEKQVQTDGVSLVLQFKACGSVRREKKRINIKKQNTIIQKSSLFHRSGLFSLIQKRKGNQEGQENGINQQNEREEEEGGERKRNLD